MFCHTYLDYAVVIAQGAAIKYGDNGYQVKAANEQGKEYLSDEGFCLTTVLYGLIARLLEKDKPKQEYHHEVYNLIL